MLVGEVGSAALFTAVAQQASQEIEPDSDLHASADYRRHLATVLVGRALAQAYERTNQGG